jgi:peptidoglycan/LPS O-acetylase OafA/YrhL
LRTAEEVSAMATTTDHLDELTRPELERHDPEVPGVGEARPRPTGTSGRSVVAGSRRPFRARLLEPIPARWAAIGAAAWVVLLTIGIAVEPAADNPNAVDPWYVSALGTVLLVAMVGMLAGFWLRRRWSLAASLLASGILVLSTVMCPVSGHHANVGAWWVVQLGCGLGLVATSTLGLRRA